MKIHYDDIKVKYTNGKSEKFRFNVSTHEGIKERNGIMNKLKSNKNVLTVDLILNSKVLILP